MRVFQFKVMSIAISNLQNDQHLEQCFFIFINCPRALRQQNLAYNGMCACTII